jgi:hypothetical protein
MNTRLDVMKLAVPLFFAIAYGPNQGLAAPLLGSSLDTFAVLGQQGVTNVPTSTIGGNLGSAPNPSIGGGYTFTAGSLQPNTPVAFLWPASDRHPPAPPPAVTRAALLAEVVTDKLAAFVGKGLR